MEPLCNDSFLCKTWKRLNFACYVRANSISSKSFFCVCANGWLVYVVKRCWKWDGIVEWHVGSRASPASATFHAILGISPSLPSALSSVDCLVSYTYQEVSCWIPVGLFPALLPAYNLYMRMRAQGGCKLVKNLVGWKGVSSKGDNMTFHLRLTASSHHLLVKNSPGSLELL